MELFNSLTRTKEEFKPLQDKQVGVYTCGPTVYSYVTIGNWRTYVLGDLLVRTLRYLDYQVEYVMNITDVGHLTGDNLGDADTGEDRLERAAQKEGKNAWQIAEYYAQDFVQGFEKLNLTWPTQPQPTDVSDKTGHFCKATDHIEEQIKMVQAIEQAGFTYQISDGIYFDVKAYELAGHQYGQLSNLDQVKEGARVEPNKDKKDPRDFALWKFSYPQGRDFDTSQDDPKTRRHMEWPSPWGLGFPGWHIECSAMSTKYLGEQFDIHLGGEDLRSTHHPNEIAQAEAVTGKQFVTYWLHGAFLQVDGGRMGKSLGNAYTLADIEAKGYDPLALRYFYYSGHYRKPLNFTWQSLESSAQALKKLRRKTGELLAVRQNVPPRMATPDDPTTLLRTEFVKALRDDLNMPQAVSVLWQVIDSRLDSGEKVSLIRDFDRVLGLDLIQKATKVVKPGDVDLKHTPAEVVSLYQDREKARQQKDYQKADQLRQQIEGKGFQIEDTPQGATLKPIDPVKSTA